MVYMVVSSVFRFCCFGNDLRSLALTHGSDNSGARVRTKAAQIGAMRNSEFAIARGRSEAQQGNCRAAKEMGCPRKRAWADGTGSADRLSPDGLLNSEFRIPNSELTKRKGVRATDPTAAVPHSLFVLNYFLRFSFSMIAR